jgi:hypothetical protein
VAYSRSSREHHSVLLYIVPESQSPCPLQSSFSVEPEQQALHGAGCSLLYLSTHLTTIQSMIEAIWTLSEVEKSGRTALGGICSL